MEKNIQEMCVCFVLPTLRWFLLQIFAFKRCDAVVFALHKSAAKVQYRFQSAELLIALWPERNNSCRPTCTLNLSDLSTAVLSSISDSVIPAHCSYINNSLIQPELWLLTFDLMTNGTVKFSSAQELTVLTAIDRHVRDTESWSHQSHKTVSTCALKVSVHVH